MRITSWLPLVVLLDDGRDVLAVNAEVFLEVARLAEAPATG